MATEKQINKAGVYLFRPPVQRVTATINREMLVVIHLRDVKVTGVLLFDDQAPLRELPVMLGLLYQKTIEKLGVSKKNVSVKIFGVSESNKAMLDTASEWVRKHDLKLLAADTGKRVTRRVVIDCEIERVGVSYAESFAFAAHRTQDGPDLEASFLSTESAGDRNPAVKKTQSILVLAAKRVHRILSKQAIEENEACRAFVPKDPMAFLQKKIPEKFRYRWVFLYADLSENPELLASWVQTIREQFPKTKFCWVGPKSKKASPLTKALGKIKHRMDVPSAAAPGPFKENVAGILNPQGAPGPYGDVLTFSLKKRQQ